jgi:hypothetical protein
MIQVGGIYESIWGNIVKITKIEQDVVFLEDPYNSSYIAVSYIEFFKECYIKISSLEQELF